MANKNTIAKACAAATIGAMTYAAYQWINEDVDKNSFEETEEDLTVDDSRRNLPNKMIPKHDSIIDIDVAIKLIMGKIFTRVSSRKEIIAEYREEQMSLAKKMASKPRKLSKNDIFIPVNYVTGEYPTIYPQWLKNDISPRVYIDIINKLNKLNKSSLVWNEKRMLKYTKMTKSSAKMAIRKDKIALNKEMDKLLLEINNNILNPLGLNASSTLKKLDILPSEMGIIIKHIHIHCNLIAKNRKSKTISEKNDNLIILPVYEYEMTEINGETF